MAVGADDVARELRAQLPGVGVKKLHKLLYLCQGHHLAHAGVPLFAESISAWDHGPVVGKLWHRESTGQSPMAAVELDNGQLNTIGYVVSRYGRLTGRDLEDLAHAQAPWREADRDRPPGRSVHMSNDSMMMFFRRAEDDSDDHPPVDRDRIRSWLAEVDHAHSRPANPDAWEELQRRIRDAS